MILHIDMDAFYASVEERERPELAGKPLIVGGTPEGRGVVAAANYAVRKFGVQSAMATAKALRLCPHAIVVPPRIPFYAQVSLKIREILHRYTPLVEPLSLDEAFLDVQGCEHLFGSAEKIGRQIQCEILDQVRLTASVGVAPNKFLAKIASDLRKPAGFVVVDRSSVQSFLDPLPVGRLWGVGKVTNQTLKLMGVHTIGQLRRLPPDLLRKELGQGGEQLWQLAHGRDDRKVILDRDAKVISHETTFAEDITDAEQLRAWILELSEQVGYRLRRQKIRGRTIQIKVRFDDFRTITRARTLASLTNTTGVIWTTAAELIAECRRQSEQPIRLVGVGVSGLDRSGSVQKDLFADEEAESSQAIDTVADQIRERFGTSSLQRGSGIQKEGKS